MNRRTIQGLIGLCIALPAAIVLISAGLQQRYADRMYPGIRVGGIAVGGLTRDDAATKLQAALNAQTGRQLVAKYQDQTWVATPAELGLRYDAAATVATAFSIGHDGNPFNRMISLVTSRGARGEILLVSDKDESKLNAFVTKIAVAIDQPVRDPGVRFSGNLMTLTPGQDGRQLDRADTIAQLRDRLGTMSTSPIALKVATTSSSLNGGDSSAARALAATWANRSVTVTTPGASVTLSSEQIANAIRIGHPEGSGALIPYVDPAALRVYLAPLATANAVPAANTTFALKNGVLIVVQSGQEGQHLDIDAAVKLVSDAIAAGVLTVAAPLQADHPSLSNVNDVATVQQSITRFVGTPIVAQGAGSSWTLQPKDLSDWLKLDTVQDSPGVPAHLALSVRIEAVRAWVQQIAHDADRLPQDGKLSWQSGTVKVTTQSSDGYQLDTDAAVQAVLLAMEGDQRTVNLQFVVTKAAVSEDRVSQLGLTDLIGEGTSRFGGSPPERVKNIVRGAQLIDGTLIAPGATFSFDDTVGDISLNNGFVVGLIIADHETKDGVGGGICQVSTTAFRAAFWAGLPIVERHDHSYAVPYYTQGGYPEGFDATIYSPELDLKFKNDTSAYLLVQTHVDVAHAKMTVDLFGTKSGRIVKLIPGSVTNVIAHPPDLRRSDPSLPKGVVKQVDWAHDGFDVSIERVITVGDKQISREGFKSHTQPWRAIYLIGGPPAPTSTPGASKSPSVPTSNATPGVTKTPSALPPTPTPGPSKTPSTAPAATPTRRPAATPTPVP